MKTAAFVCLLQSANPAILNEIVKNDWSIVKYALNKVNIYLIKGYIAVAGGIGNVMNLNAYDVRDFLKKNRPDLLRIIDQRPGWLEKEIDYAKEILPKL